AAGDIIVDGGGERQAFATIKICFNSIRAHSFGRVEMNTDENGVAIRVRNCYARRQRHKNIAVPSHDDAISSGAKKGLEALRDVERHRLFRDPLAGNAAAVKTTVAGVDYDGR